MEKAVKPALKNAKALSGNVDVLVICLSLCVPAVYYGGLSAFIQIISCVLTTAVSEFVFMKFLLKRSFSPDLSFLVNGLVIALLLPASVPFYVGIAASVFSVAVGVFPFGGFNNTPFQPAAVGIAFSAVAFKAELIAVNDLASLISDGNMPSLDFFVITDILSGAFPGAMGCTCILALIAAAVYLFIRDKKRLSSSAGYILATVIFAFIFPRVNSGRLASVFLELSSGCLLFTSLILINYRVTSPDRTSRAFIYGVLGGVITMLMRYFSFSALPEISAVLFINALWPAVTGETVNRKQKQLASSNKKKEAAVQ